MLGNVNTSSALSAFEIMEEKILAMESQSEVLNQRSTDELEAKFALVETSIVDNDLADLKKELFGSTKFQKEYSEEMINAIRLEWANFVIDHL
ncbi:plastid transcriptionally active 4 [Perilla frutescens var. hirtella]|nr:plastid transcriptionally active 4 [Perilla frutescens var. frutescens]KAH6786879.1 plastid transcriptionally active 4 [Perilla frutescens var. hirtella]